MSTPTPTPTPNPNPNPNPNSTPNPSSQSSSAAANAAGAVASNSVADSSADSSAAAQLSPEDLARVDKYLSSAIHSVERKPFRPYMMMALLTAVVLGLGFLSIMISWLVL